MQVTLARPYGLTKLASLRSLLRALPDQLGEKLVASFTFLEHGVAFNIVMHHRGAFTIQVTLQPDTGDTERLVFELGLDASLVTDWVNELDGILSHFPPAITVNYAPAQDISHAEPSAG